MAKALRRNNDLARQRAINTYIAVANRMCDALEMTARRNEMILNKFGERITSDSRGTMTAESRKEEHVIKPPSFFLILASASAGIARFAALACASCGR